MTNQDAMRIKHFLNKVLERKSDILSGYDRTHRGAEKTAIRYIDEFEKTAIEALDLLGEIEWPDQQKTED